MKYILHWSRLSTSEFPAQHFSCDNKQPNRADYLHARMLKLVWAGWQHVCIRLKKCLRPRRGPLIEFL